MSVVRGEKVGLVRRPPGTCLLYVLRVARKPLRVSLWLGVSWNAAEYGRLRAELGMQKSKASRHRLAAHWRLMYPVRVGGCALDEAMTPVLATPDGVPAVCTIYKEGAALVAAQAMGKSELENYRRWWMGQRTVAQQEVGA